MGVPEVWLLLVRDIDKALYCIVELFWFSIFPVPSLVF